MKIERDDVAVWALTSLVHESALALHSVRAMMAQALETEERLVSILRGEMERAGKKSCDFPDLQITRKSDSRTYCVCHDREPWSCTDRHSGVVLYEAPWPERIVVRKKMGELTALDGGKE